MIKLFLSFTIICAVHSVTFSQHVKISGEVSDNTQNPIGGVNIIVKGTAIGTVSDQNGKFDILVPPGREILLFNFIGFKSLEQEIFTTIEMHYRVKVTLVRDKLKNRKDKSASKIVATPIKK